LLDRRKNWRSHYPPEQKGDKCTMMGEWQELSGVEVPGDPHQKEFWKSVRQGKGLDLREGERLCAIAYVKRRFVHVWETLHTGWKLPSNVPSVSYMAAVHWLEQLIKADPDEQAVKKLCDEAKKAGSLGERLTHIKCITDSLQNKGNLSQIANIDGRLFFENELRQLEEDKKNKEGEISSSQAKAIRDARTAVITSVLKKQPDFPKDPTPFYAILLMDGDHLGKNMAIEKNQKPISQALAVFTKQVQPVVEGKNGFLVYAGGDDVLAILPLEDAMQCAADLRYKWTQAFKKQDSIKDMTISAAIEYAHMKMPLTAILKDAHRLLKEVAKDATDRDALACRVWKPGGEQLTWSKKWDDALIGNILVLEKLAKEFQKEEEDEPGHASKPLFRIRERLRMLEGVRDFDLDQIQKLLVAEYVTSGVLRKIKTKEGREKIAIDRIAALLPQCKKSDNTYGAEAAMLLRFLAQKGMER
jgi:CRISPR-associated protein Cmr2